MACKLGFTIDICRYRWLHEIESYIFDSVTRIDHCRSHHYCIEGSGSVGWLYRLVSVAPIAIQSSVCGASRHKDSGLSE